MAAAVVLYLVVVLLYAFSGRVAVIDDETAVDDGTVILELRAERVDPSANRITVTVTPLSFGPLPVDESGLTTTEDLSVLVSGGSGGRILTFPAGELRTGQEVELVADGDIENWPFDRYTATSVIVAAHEVDGELQPLPTVLVGEGSVTGWALEAAITTLPGAESSAESSAETDADTAASVGSDGGEMLAITIDARRAGATVAFAIVLLSLMVVMPVLVLTVAITVLRGRRKVEATMMSWIGAMLFATIPLRNFLPGSPPIGSWVDYLIVLWVIAGLVVGLIVFVVAWLRMGPAGDRAAGPG